jgi:hypothetical protein
MSNLFAFLRVKNLRACPERLRCVLLLLLALAPASLRAQSTLTTTPNIPTGWVLDKHEMLFDLVHRFSIGPAPDHKVQNASTLTLHGAIFTGFQAELSYASASELIPDHPNEFEFSARGRLVRQATGAPLDLFLEGAYNQTVGSLDGQVNIGRRFGRARATVTGSFLGDAFNTGKGRGALGAGVIVPIASKMALAGDITTLLNRASTEPVAWSVGLQMAIVETPHTLSINASNVASRTLQGSLSGTHNTRVGFEYTIPITFGARRTAITGSTSKAMP